MVTTLNFDTPNNDDNCWSFIDVMSDIKDELPPNICPTVAVVAIGQAFMPGTREAIGDSLRYAQENGYRTPFMIIHNLVVQAPMGISEMRNLALCHAMILNADWVLIMDNDVLLAPESIFRLLQVNRPIVVPWFDQTPFMEGSNHWERLALPSLRPGQGIVPLHWAVWSCVLIDKPTMRLMGKSFFSGDMITNYDNYLATKLLTDDIYMWQDTNNIVKLLRGPGKIWSYFGKDNPNPATSEHQTNLTDSLAIVVKGTTSETSDS